jgi:tetratricopeptide (TPR) repeat protein
MNEALPDDLVMDLVDQAQARPAGERDAFLESVCGDNAALLAEVREYLYWEGQMGGFLREPVLSRPAADVNFQPGDLLAGRFRIFREIAHGGMGIVYEALDERLDRRIALKCARAGHGNRLPPEVRHASEVSHANVCKIFEIHTAATDRGEVDFITMELLEGETLAARLARGSLPEPEARTIARQICAGVGEAHRHQVIHGDLKTNNIILAREPDGSVRAVVMDFGLARRPGTTMRTAQSEQAGGTPGYMAPELWNGEKLTPRSDVYALGVILYELACASRSKAKKEEPESRRDARKNGTLPRVNRRWDPIIARCCEAAPESRYPNASEVAKALEPTLTRRRILYAAAALILAALSGVLTYKQATAPAQTVRLAVLPLAAPDAAASTANLALDAAAAMERLKGNERIALKVIPFHRVMEKQAGDTGAAAAKLGATHVLVTRAAGSGARVDLHVRVIDTKTGTTVHQWNGAYSEAELRLAPAALAGVVTAAFHLPAPPLPAVNGRAQSDYARGLPALRRLSRVDDALAAMERAVASDPDSVLTHTGLAEARWLKFSWTQDRHWLELAEESVRNADARAPDAAAVHRVRSLVQMSNGLYDQALASCRRAMELEPANSDAYRRMGQVFQANGQHAEAEAALRKAVELEPDYFRNHQLLAWHLMQRGNDAGAVAEYRKAVDLEPSEPYLRMRLALGLRNLGQFDDAEKELKAARGAETDAGVLAELGCVLIYRGRDAEAAKFLQKAVELDPRDLTSATYLGLAYKRAGQKRQARSAYLKALALAETNLATDPRNGRDRAALGYILAELGDQRRALAEVTQALRLSPDSSVQWSAVQAYEALGRRDLTLRVLDRFTPSMLEDAKRWPVLAGLREDPHFLKGASLRQEQ